MREIVLDTETTGLSPEDGDKIIEIGCVELWNRVPTGKVFHQYIDPERTLSQISIDITGLTNEFLSQFQPFSAYADAFLEFIQDSPLVIHNAKFDVHFLNYELQQLGKPSLDFSRAVDTLLIARKKFPGSPASLDALTKRFEIKIPREKHGALLDAQILAEVYIELTGGRQRTFGLEDIEFSEEIDTPLKHENASSFPHRSFPLPHEEALAFQQMLTHIKDPLWNLIKS